MIITDPIALVKQCADVSLMEVSTLITSLETELSNSAAPGVGLAAPQIGIHKKVCIIRTRDLSLDLANPKIITRYDLSEFDNEGCLSFPGVWLTTKRYAEIVVKDLLHPAGLIFTGIEAVMVQHEIDHLEGRTMYDYEIKRPQRNDVCWCGATKYKKCHMRKVILIRKPNSG